MQQKSDNHNVELLHPLVKLDESPELDTATSEIHEIPDEQEQNKAQSDQLQAAEQVVEYDPSSFECYLNRELTWLEFIWRVLHEAQDPRTPLLERIKFLAIVGSNLDEFFMKRIGGLKEQVGAGVQDLTDDGRTPQEQINECYDIVRNIETETDLQIGRAHV